MHGADDAIVTVDVMGRITSWNAGAERLFGHPAAHAVGGDATVLLAPGQTWIDVFGPALAGLTQRGVDVVRRHASGAELHVNETLSPLTDEQGAVVGAVCIGRDISVRRRAEAETAALREELERKNLRLELSNRDLEQIAYVASHDLSEPLRAVAGMVGLLQRRYQGRLDADADEFIEFAVAGCERMRHLIDDLLDYARVGRREPELVDVDLTAVVARALEHVGEHVAAAGATVHVEPLPRVLGDEPSLVRVVQNLIGNAVKFHRPDVAPVVRVHAELAPDPAGAEVRVAVTDNGIGVPPAQRARVFQMFRRLHTTEEYPGTGIGLAVVERIVTLHGGRVGIDDAPAGGTVVWFTLRAAS